MMTLKGIYIDDDIEAVTALKRRLESERLALELRPPGDLVKTADYILEQAPAVVVLDYRLDERRNDLQNTSGYRAGPLAQLLRDRSSDRPDRDFPIVLFSSEDKLRNFYKPEKTAHDLFDWKLKKSEVGQSTVGRTVLLGLADGYAVLRGVTVDFAESIPTIFGIDEQDDYLIDHQELLDSLKQAAFPHIAARYILNFVIKREGLLLNRYGLQAKLGLTDSSDDDWIAIDKWLSDQHTRYLGAFADCQQLWWNGKVEALLANVFGGPVASLTATERAKRLAEILSRPLNPAKDRWTCSPDFVPVFACASCRLPTSREHSLACLDGGLPPFVQRHRVCWTCVQTDLLPEHDLKVDARDLFIETRLRNGELAREKK